MYANINYIYGKLFEKILIESEFYMKLKVLSLIIAVFSAFSLLFVTASADESRIEASMKSFSQPSGEIIGISSKGEWDRHPENSVPALIAAAETDIDFVAIDIRKTADGVLIAFSDDTTERMLYSEQTFTVSDTAYEKLSALPLRTGCGGSNEKASENTIPTMEEMIKAAGAYDIPLILRCGIDIVKDVTKKLSDLGATDMCIVMTNGKVKEITPALSDAENKPLIIGAIKGNVIFNIMSYINGLEEAGASGVQLNTTNRYGINYYRSLLSSYSAKMRVICDTTTPEVSGFREDSEMYWNDLISRGYSVIITDHAQRFCEYKTDCNEARAALQELYDRYVTNHTLPDFRDEYLSDIKKAYTDAVSAAEALLSDASSSLRDMQECFSKLNKAANDVNKNFSSLEDGSAGTTVTPVRIALCVAAVIAVVVVQIYFFRKRKKVV